MRILVTGGCGFIGSNFINFIENMKNDVYIVNIDKLDYCSNLHNIESSCKTYINDTEKVLEILHKESIDTVIHFAAQTHVDNSFITSLNFTRDNILGTHSLLEACRIYGKIFKFIHISTDEVYGQTEGACENSIMNPTNPYAASKAAAECIVKSYYYSFNLPIIICRMNNVYGTSQHPEKIIPKFIKSIKEGKKCTVHGNGYSRRAFVHTHDVCDAIYTLLTKGRVPEIYNIGTENKDLSVLELLDLILKTIKPGESLNDWIDYVPDRNFNDFRYLINSDKLKKLGWSEQKEFYTELVKLCLN
jgi:dTDP-glucose 4,6-dehydratase/UDP-glucose 4,6-dehydratase